MANLDLTFAVMPSLLTQPLLDSQVVPKGINLQGQPPKSIDDNSRRMVDLEFDIGEVAISTFLNAYDVGTRVRALPLFTSGRRFLQNGFLRATRSAIQDLSELHAGGTIATAQYWLASAIWQREILSSAYGVEPEDVSWVTLQPERMDSMTIPSGIIHRLETSGRDAEELAATGVIDVNLTTGGGQSGQRRVGAPLVPAFADRAAAEREYFQRTGIFPILHVTVIKQELVEREPWVVESICEAYLQAKGVARANERPDPSQPARAGEATPELRELVGEDPWAYGLTANQKALTTFVGEAFSQGLISTHYSLEDIFGAPLPDSMK